MALSYVGYASAAGTSVSLPTFAAGDLALVFAYRDGSNTYPDLPFGWTDIHSNGANSNSSRLAYRVLQASDVTTGVWTNATEIQVLVLRGQVSGTPWLGKNASGLNNSTTVTYSAVDVQDTTAASSWVVGFCGHRTATDVNSRAFAGMTNRSSGSATSSLGCHTQADSFTDVGGGDFQFPAVSATVNAQSASRATTVEILAEPATPQTGTAEVSLGAAQVPATRTLHTLVVRARATSGTGSLRVRLYEGATARSSELTTGALTSSFVTYELAVADADAANIVSYANLSVTLQGVGAGTYEVAALELRLPQPAAGAIFGSVDMPVVFGAVTDGVVTSAGDKSTGTFEVSLASGVTPATRTNHSLVIRARKVNAAHTGTIRAQLFEGATARTAELESDALTDSLAAYTLAVPDADAATITDYANLSVRVRGYASAGDATQYEVADVSLVTPASGVAGQIGAATLATTVSITVGESAALLVYPGASVYPHALATVSATGTITAAFGPIYRYSSVTSPFVLDISTTGQIPLFPFGAAVLASTATITAAGAAAGDRIGAAVLASTATITVSGEGDVITGAAVVSATATVTVTAADAATPPAPPDFMRTFADMPDLLVAVAFDSQPLATIQLYEAVIAYTRQANTSRGRQFELDRFEAGNSHMLFDNLDGRWNPENVSSPYYPGLKPTRRMRIAAAWNAVTYDLFNGFLEGYPTEYRQAGFDRIVAQNAVDLFMALAVAKFIPATTTLTSNLALLTAASTETLTVSNTTLPMPQVVPFDIKVGTETMTVTAVSGLTYTVNRTVEGAAEHEAGATVTAQAVSFGQEYTGQRIQNVLDHANIALPVSIDTGQTLLAPSEDLAGSAPLEHIQLVAEVEQGRFFAAKDGTLTFHERHHFYANEKTSRAVFGDDGGTELSYVDAKVTHDDTKLYNIIRITAADGTVHEARDTASIQDHFERVLEKQWPLADANEALAAAEYLLSRLSRMQVRIPEMTLLPVRDPDDQWPVALGLEIGQRYDFKLRPKDGSTMIDKTLVIEGVGYSVAPAQVGVAAQMSLADTTVYGQLDVPGQAELDTTARLTY